MEVNDLKNLWRDSFSDKESKLSPEEINERLKLKSKSNFLMRKVKRSFQFELIFGAFFTILGLFKLIPETNTMKEVLYLGLFVLVMIVLFGFVFMKYRKFNGIKILQDQLRPALEQWIKILEKYVKFNTSKFTKFILLPAAMILGFSLGLSIGADDLSMAEIFDKLGTQKIIFVVIVGSGMYLLMLPIAKWGNKKLYGSHLNELKQCLKDLEELEEE